MADITLDAVSKTYEGGVEAVRSVDLQISNGEFVVLVGPSGCGKSTILRMIAGLEEVTSGDLYIAGKRVNDTRPKDRDIAMVFQNFALYPHMTVAQNMGFGLKLRRIPKAESAKRVQDAAVLLGIEELLARRPGDLSGGQRQRVALGRAIVRQPQVFLFDEPLSNLDARLRVQMRMELSRLHQRLKTTMVYVTHDQVEAMTMGERIVVMDQGRIQQVDAPLKVYAHPANRFVAGFIGSPAMNFLDARVEQEEGVLTLSCPVLDLHASLSGNQFDFLSPMIGRELVLGLRPEHVTNEPPPGKQHGFVVGTFRLDVVEPMGNEVVLHLSRSGQDVVARIPPRRVPGVGYAIDVGLDLAHAHFFDAESGANLRIA